MYAGCVSCVYRLHFLCNTGNQDETQGEGVRVKVMQTFI